MRGPVIQQEDILAEGYPWFPSSAPYFETDYTKQYVRDRRGTIWLIVRDGGMVTTADYSGKIYSAGIEWLRRIHGPLEEL